MKFLVVGAGALGGYFGGRLLQAGCDVSFLLRPDRAAQFAASGLVIHSPAGDLHWPTPPVVLPQQIRQPYDVVMVACKAYDLEEAISAFAPAIGPETVVLPLLNGLRHIDRLSERFGGRRVIGGFGGISAVLDETGAVLHLSREHTLGFGELYGARSTRVDAIAAAFSNARFDSQPSDAILQVLWERWVHVAALAGITTLLRANIGDVVQAGAHDLALDIVDECARIAAHNGFAPRAAALDRTRSTLTATGSTLTASMLRDIERGARTEGEHILGDLLRRGRWFTTDTVLLPVAYAQVQSHEARCAREAAEAMRSRRRAA
ncbi:2-dehydropantoate 2-reductase [soil metagenome]